jgi:hypothetical protein
MLIIIVGDFGMGVKVDFCGEKGRHYSSASLKLLKLKALSSQQSHIKPP